jgi:hypothetical protein
LLDGSAVEERASYWFSARGCDGDGPREPHVDR